MHLLSIELDRNPSANALKLPPLVVVQLRKGAHVVSELHEMAARVLLWVEDSRKDLNPVVKLAWLDKEWEEPHVDGHVEDLRDQDHDLELIWTVRPWNDALHHGLESWEEVLGNTDQNFPLLVNFELECPDDLFERTQSNQLRLLVLSGKSLLDVRQALLPVPWFKIRLSNVVNDVFKFRSKIKDSKIRHQFQKFEDQLILRSLQPTRLVVILIGLEFKKMKILIGKCIFWNIWWKFWILLTISFYLWAWFLLSPKSQKCWPWWNLCPPCWFVQSGSRPSVPLEQWASTNWRWPCSSKGWQREGKLHEQAEILHRRRESSQLHLGSLRFASGFEGILIVAEPARDTVQRSASSDCRSLLSGPMLRTAVQWTRCLVLVWSTFVQFPEIFRFLQKLVFKIRVFLMINYKCAN